MRANVTKSTRPTKPTRLTSELRQIPGVGPSIAGDLHGIGITHIAQLKDADPQALYDAVCDATGEIHDRCLLYVFRCAVYYASTAEAQHDPEKLQWWYWKD